MPGYLTAALFLLSAAGVTSERFGDWEIVCPAPPAEVAAAAAAPVGVCRLQQAQAVNGGKDVVFLFNIVLQADRPVAIISAPLNVYLPAGLTLRVDAGRVERAMFESCNVSGCHAGFALGPALLAALKRGMQLVVTLQDTKVNKIPVKVSLNGISAGLKTLSERLGAAAAGQAAGQQ
ncbi:invasion associated locus B family protein [Pararhizobium sp.]|uniref:invasion associated locus B family protein n=1 Tax=Pararhizobium sp. TaxID=1977563 RepID=UPI002724D1BF|nr:invasion associated locus B family protein [Pararhizobium sp.]MDO9415814.1 invasion associated locus B family protein [Pararhizobium sp.]